MSNKLGLVLSGVYLLAALYLITTQGLFGESFITVILGMPWTLGLAYVEYFSASGPLLYVLALAPIALNAYVLYKLGGFFSR